MHLLVSYKCPFLVVLSDGKEKEEKEAEEKRGIMCVELRRKRRMRETAEETKRASAMCIFMHPHVVWACVGVGRKSRGL